MGVPSTLTPNMEKMIIGDRVECSTVRVYGKPAQGKIAGTTDTGRFKVELDTGRVFCPAPETLTLVEAAPRITPVPMIKVG